MTSTPWLVTTTLGTASPLVHSSQQGIQCTGAITTEICGVWEHSATFERCGPCDWGPLIGWNPLNPCLYRRHTQSPGKEFCIARHKRHDPYSHLLISRRKDMSLTKANLNKEKDDETLRGPYRRSAVHELVHGKGAELRKRSESWSHSLVAL